MLIPKQYITLDYNTGETVRIDDITGNYTSQNQGGFGISNPPIFDVTQIRFMFSSFLTERDADQNVTECLTNVEYEVYPIAAFTPGPAPRVIVDTKIFTSGNKFVLMSDQTPTITNPSVLAIRETGRYAAVVPFLPPDEYTTFAPSAFGVDSLIFPDSAYKSTYEVYTTDYVAGESVPSGTYIVKGDPLNRIQLNSLVEYYAGEVFTSSGTFQFLNLEGVNTICKLEASSERTFPLCYNAMKVKNEILSSYTSQGCPCRDQLEAPLNKVDSRLMAIENNYADQLNNSDSYTQTLLDEIASIGVNVQLC